MKNILTFLIPVRHPDNAPDWQRLKEKLQQTIKSISAQDDARWKAVIIANEGAELPDLPKNFEIRWVDFPPNPHYAREAADLELYRQAVRLDKGRRIQAGMLHAGEMGHVMLADDDDFVSRRLTSFVAANARHNGWYFKSGLIWSDGGSLLYRYEDFSHLCGTSHIIRSDLYQIPAGAAQSEDYISRLLGSHVFIREHLAQRGTPLQPLPFIGAVYRTGHAGSHSRSKGVISQYMLKKYLLKQPLTLLDRVSRLQVKNARIEHEFFGR